jgi:hypothetical protein
MRRVQRAPGTSHLLVVVHHRARHLVVDDEGQVGLVVAHAQGRRCNQRLHLVVEQRLLQRFPALARLAGVRLDQKAPALEPAGHLFGVAYGQGIDDAVAGQRRELLRQPGQALCLAGKVDRLQGQRGPVQIAARHREPRAEDGLEVLHDPVVGRRGGCQQPNVGRQGADNALQ